MKQGIEIVSYDKVQPYRVWWNHHIFWFARTQGEAEYKLQEEKDKRDKFKNRRNH
ncbi:hypothetical protein LCGC14_1145870 [marine sediment metagenome]|uniref:Uncharacterized protein n=1 Tax=marine sediment metagenome TaxID=412755 RepID=A0A0F9M1R0_9ZZZZ